MPRWYTVLSMAKEWGVPPWQIVGGHPYLWEIRWRVIRNIEAEAGRDRNNAR